MKEISAKAHGDGYMSFSSNFWLDFVTVWGVIRLNLEPTQKADCISRIFIPKIDSPERGQGDIAWCMAYQLPLIWIMRFVAQFQNNFNQKYWLEGPCFLKGNVI